MSKTKVLHIITRLIPGGADENTLFTVQGLDRNKFDVHLLVGAESELGPIGDIGEVQVLLLDDLVRAVRPVKDILALLKMYRLIRHERYDIVHTHTAKAGFIGRLAAWFARTPIIIHGLHGITFHDALPRSTKLLYVFLEKLAGRFTNTFVTVGEDLVTRYLEKGIGRKEQYIVIRSGFKLEKFQKAASLGEATRIAKRRELGIDASDIVVGCIGRLEPRKGHVYLFQVAQKLAGDYSHVKFAVIGDGHLRRELEAYRDELGLTDKIVFLGFREDIAEVMAVLDVVALTSLWEGLPRVLVQAAVLGKPIVTFDVEGAREVVHDGENGYVVPIRDVPAMTRKLRTLLDDLGIAAEMGRKGQGIVDDSWTAESMSRQVCALYEKLVAECKEGVKARSLESLN